MEISALENAVSHRQLGQWHVFYKELKTTTIIPINQQYLNTFPDYRFSVFGSVIIKSTQLEDLLKALKQTTCVNVEASIARSLSLRWGTTFYDRMGKQVYSVYLDGLRDEGFVNNQRVQFGSEVKQWFINFTKAHFS